jgi:hypothetical protein
MAKKLSAIPPSGPENPMMQTIRRVFPADATSSAPDSGLMEAEKSASFKKARRGRSGLLLSGSTLSDKPETLGSPGGI